MLTQFLLHINDQGRLNCVIIIKWLLIIGQLITFNVLEIIGFMPNCFLILVNKYNSNYNLYNN